jgi:hypothetical protein
VAISGNLGVNAREILAGDPRNLIVAKLQVVVFAVLRRVFFRGLA